MPLADTILRTAEHPRLRLPKWSSHIMDEVSRSGACPRTTSVVDGGPYTNFGNPWHRKETSTVGR
jgi:hypothetical protein